MTGLMLAGGILLEGIKLLGAERASAINAKEHKLISALSAAKARDANSEIEYTDARVVISEQELEAFVLAYSPEVAAEMAKINKAGIWPPKAQS